MTSDSEADPPLIRPISAPMEVPVFNVVIYVSRVSGGVRARAANLPDLDVTASGEPQALKLAIEEAKRRLAGWHEAGESVPWIEPILSLESGESERWVPVHL